MEAVYSRKSCMVIMHGRSFITPGCSRAHAMETRDFTAYACHARQSADPNLVFPAALHCSHYITAGNSEAARAWH